MSVSSQELKFRRLAFNTVSHSWMSDLSKVLDNSLPERREIHDLTRTILTPLQSKITKAQDLVLCNYALNLIDPSTHASSSIKLLPD